MNTLIMNGARVDDNILDQIGEIIVKAAEKKNWSIKQLMLRDKEVAECKGCFNCWVKTPGKCVIVDDAQEITKSIIKSDIVIYLTPVVFGGYSYHLKKVLDRSICLVSPFFTRVEGEIHHKKRYSNYPFTISVGISSQCNKEEKEVFNTLVERNALNLHVSGCKSKIFSENTSIDKLEIDITNLLDEVGEIT